MSQPPGQPDGCFNLEQAQAVLRERFGHAAFRPGQPEALDSIRRGRSLLVVMPTGSGKSLLFQLPALLEDGITLVVSPLIALMKDQVDDLARRNIPATFINSSLGLDEQRERMARCLAGGVRILYVAPERFRSGAFLDLVRRLKVARMAVDEAHCISEWGHDFRPDYRRLRDFRQEMGRPLVTALTATATPRVQQDIIESLGLARAEVDVHIHGFDRPNLALSAQDAPTEEAKNEFILDFLRRERGSGIIYVGTRQMAEDVAGIVKTVDRSVTFYHAGMEPEDRTAAQEAFLSGKVRVAVATIAFGMGIDKRDIRFVLHYHYPGSVEQYYQEIGRAGRDDLPSRCVLLYAPADHFLREFFIDLNYPTPEQVQNVYEALWSIPDNPVLMTYKEIAEGCEGVKEGQVGSAVRLLDGAGLTRALAGEAAARVGLDRPGAEILKGLRGDTQRRVFEALASTADLETPGDFRIELSRLAAGAGLAEDQVRRALAAMAQAGHIDYEPPFRGRGIGKLADPPPPFDEVPIDWKRQEFLRGLEEEKLEAIEDYIHTYDCRRRFILNYFGEKSDLSCGKCDRCGAGGAQGPPAGEPATAAAGNAAWPAPVARPARPAVEDIGGPPPRPDRPPVPHPRPAALSRPATQKTHPDVAAAVLACIKNLRFPIGIGRIAQVLTGSRDKDILAWRLNRNPAYGAVHGRQDAVKRAVEDLLRRGYLKREGDVTRPVLALTARGKRAAEELEQAEAERAAEPSCVARPACPAAGDIGGPPPRPDKPAVPHPRPDAGAPASALPQPSPAADLDRCVRRMLVADRGEAQALVEHLRLYHPGALAARLEQALRASDDVRVQSRAVWAAGELGGEHALALLIGCTQSETANVRRLAASALGKVGAAARTSARPRGDALAQARTALQALLGDDAPQVRQYARKSLAQFEEA